MSAIVHAQVATRWRPSRTVAASMVLHSAALIAVIHRTELPKMSSDGNGDGNH